jgi:RNA polymerase sigma-70 factor (ECF subfamily)
VSAGIAHYRRTVVAGRLNTYAVHGLGPRDQSERISESGAAVSGYPRDPFASSLIAQLPGLRRYALALVGNASLADDLVQDCIERALRRAATLEDPKRIAGWLRSILHNLYMDELRKKRSQGTGVDIAEMENSAVLSIRAGEGGNVDFVRALNGLSIEHRQILLMVGLEGLSYREVADELNLPIGTVMSRVARARERLRGALEQGADNDADADNAPGRRI